MADEGVVISYQEFIKQSRQYVKKVENYCRKEYGLGTHERFWYDQQTGEITFIDKDIVTIRAKFQDIGSLHLPTKSWLWAWDNNNTLRRNKEKMWTVKAFGEKNGFKFLTEPMLKKVSEKEGRRLAAMAIFVLQAEGGYMFSVDDGLIVYLALFEIQKVDSGGR